MPVVKICDCDKPENWVNNAGEIQGNACKRCGGRVEPIQEQPEPPTYESSVGRLIIEVQGTCGELEFRSDQERHEFPQHVRKTLRSSLRQKLDIWRVNRATQDDVHRAQAIDVARRKSATM